MKLTPQIVQKIADLARLEIKADELDYYAKEISAILEYVEQLNKIETKGIEVMAQATELYTVGREDGEYNFQKDIKSKLTASILKLAPFTERGFIKVKNVFKDK